MRMFVAAILPDRITDALAETSALLRSSVKGRFVAPNSFHVTLAFLGEVEAARIDAIGCMLDKACAGYAPIAVKQSGLGSFGRRRSAVLWQGFQDNPALLGLAADVRSALKDGGFTFDEKAFKPHVTLMRAADLTAGELPSPAIASGVIKEITLFKSDLSGKRPVYEPLHTTQLERKPCYLNTEGNDDTC